VSFDRSEVATSGGACSFAFEILISCRIFRYSRLGGASLLSELSWSIRLAAVSAVAPY
jgi:hypothetical protein